MLKLKTYGSFGHNGEGAPKLKQFNRKENKDAFDEIRDKLVKKYQGSYVAIAEAKLIDSDKEKSVLAKRIAIRPDHASVYIGKVVQRVIPTIYFDMIEGRIENGSKKKTR